MSLSQLDSARALVLPSREAMLQRAPSVLHFWDSNRDLLSNAWREWEANEKAHLALPTSALISDALREAVEQAWEDPTKEEAVRALWKEVSPGVFQAQFFDPTRLAELRSYMDAIANAGIPLRPPYGIVLNRRGAMLDPRSEGYLAAPSFQDFYQELMEKYMRPIARLFFPEITGLDSQTFGFSMNYQAGMDTSLRLHTDASAATLNINLNMPGEDYTGSEVDFYDMATRKVTRVNFTPGMAMIHRGSVPHAAHPITSGSRSNFVFWLYGDYGQVPYPKTQPVEIDAQLRWALPTSPKDMAAPF